MYKVLHVIWNAKFGGIEKLVFDLCRFQLQGEGVIPELLLLKNEGEYLNRFSKLNLKIHHLGFKNGTDFNFKKIAKAKSLVGQYDIVHVHCFNPSIALALILSKRKTIYTIHGGFGFGRKRRVNDIILEKLKSLYLRKYVSVLTYNSKFTKKYAEKTLNTYNHKNAHLVYNGVPFHDFISKDLKELEQYRQSLQSKFVIGTSSRFAGFKRIDRLIKAFSKLKNRNEYSLLLVGEGVLRRALEEQVKALGIENEVIFTGYQANVAAFQNTMDVCVFPSQNEPFGLVAVETLNLGKPTIVFKDGGGITEIISLNNQQDVVKDEEGLINRIEFYKNDKDKVEAIAKRKNTASLFSLDRMGNNFLNLYEMAINSAR